MAIRRSKKRFDIRSASCNALWDRLLETEVSLKSKEAYVERFRREVEDQASKTRDLNEQFLRISREMDQLSGALRPLPGPLGSILGLKALPKETKEKIRALNMERANIDLKRMDIPPLSNYLKLHEDELNRLQNRCSALEKAIDQRYRKANRETALVLAAGEAVILQESLGRLRERSEKWRAAATATCDATRKLADTLRPAIPQQSMCPYCGLSLGESPHLDHIYPVGKGGRSVPQNMVWACSGCNNLKRDLTLAGFAGRYNLDRPAIEARLEELGKDY